jgi:hypothetical protein
MLRRSMSFGWVVPSEALLDAHAFIGWDGEQSKISTAALAACQSSKLQIMGRTNLDESAWGRR